MNALFNVAVVLVVLASIRLWIVTAARFFNGLSEERPLSREQPSVVPWGLSDILLAIVLQSISSGFAHEWFRAHYGLTRELKLHELGIQLSANYVALMAAASLAAMVAMVVWLIVRYRVRGAALAVEAKTIASDLLLGLRMFLMLAPVVYGIQLILVQFVQSEHPLIEMLKKNPSPRFFLASGFAAAIAAPIVEEFFFRLLLQGWFQRLATRRGSTWKLILGGRLEADPIPVDQSPANPSEDVVTGNQVTAAEAIEATSSTADGAETQKVLRRPRWPIIASAALFAAAHASNGPDPVPLFVFALGLGYLYQRTNRILASIFVHFLLNAATLSMMWLALREGA
jgi:membrane protease YdiL (CAAX protease family)